MFSLGFGHRNQCTLCKMVWIHLRTCTYFEVSQNKMTENGAIHFCNGAWDRKVTRPEEKKREEFPWHGRMPNTIFY